MSFWTCTKPMGATSTCSARIPHPPSPAATGTAMASSAEQRRSRVVGFLWLSRWREIRRENKNHQIFEICSTHFWWIHRIVHAIHTSILNSCPSMLMNVHHLLYLHRSQKISFTILAADRIFKVVMNMVVKSSPHQKHCSSVSLLVLEHDDLCEWTCRFREVELFGKEEFDIHLCGTKDLELWFLMILVLVMWSTSRHVFWCFFCRITLQMCKIVSLCRILRCWLHGFRQGGMWHHLV